MREYRERPNRLVLIHAEIEDKTSEHSEGGDRADKNSEHSVTGRIFDDILYLEIAGLDSGKKFRLKKAGTVTKLTLPKQKLDIDFICGSYEYIDRSILETIGNTEPKVILGQDNIGLILLVK
ncbi:hypothetical protein JTB14_027198 [Gonioctena quinquepunctata]|nr:hypothetical protein JTB14_027198 [Gonioctena quinquepunctata]